MSYFHDTRQVLSRNHWFRDPRLSDKSKGRLAYIGTHAPGYKLSLKQMLAETKCGRDTLYGEMKELIALGYIERYQERGGRNNTGQVHYRYGPAAFVQAYDRQWGSNPRPIAPQPANEPANEPDIQPDIVDDGSPEWSREPAPAFANDTRIDRTGNVSAGRCASGKAGSANAATTTPPDHQPANEPAKAPGIRPGQGSATASHGSSTSGFYASGLCASGKPAPKEYKDKEIKKEKNPPPTPRTTTRRAVPARVVTGWGGSASGEELDEAVRITVALRPLWSRARVIAAMDQALAAGYQAHRVVWAIVDVAKDPTTIAPGRITQDAWWTAVAPREALVHPLHIPEPGSGPKEPEKDLGPMCTSFGHGRHGRRLPISICNMCRVERLADEHNARLEAAEAARAAAPPPPPVSTRSPRREAMERLKNDPALRALMERMDA